MGSSHTMFRRLVLLAALLVAVYSWCTPFISCNQTIYGDFGDMEKGLKVVLLGRPFQKYDELIVTGEFYNNGSDVMDDAFFKMGLSKGMIMHQLGDDPSNYLFTAYVATDDNPLNVTGYVAGRGRNEFGYKTMSSAGLSCNSTSFQFKIKSQDGYGFAVGNRTKYNSAIPSQYPKKERAKSVFFGGQIRTSKLELKCRDFA